jgi:hypothetical protein
VAPGRFSEPQSHVWLRGGPSGSGVRPSSPYACASSGCGLSAAAGWECRYLYDNGLTGPLPTELGTLTALLYLCVRRPHPPRLDAYTVTELWAKRGGVCGRRYLLSNSLTGPLPTELGNLDALIHLCVPALTHRARPRAPSPGCGLSVVVAVGCRDLSDNDLMGTLPTELGTLTALTYLCVRISNPPRLDVTALWAEVVVVWVAGIYTATLSRGRCPPSWGPWTR